MSAGWSCVLARAFDDWRKASQRRAVVEQLQSVNPRLLQDVGLEPPLRDTFVKTRNEPQSPNRIPINRITPAVGASQRGPVIHGPR